MHPLHSRLSVRLRWFEQSGWQNLNCRFFWIEPISHQDRSTTKMERTAARPWRRSKSREGLLQAREDAMPRSRRSALVP